MTPPALWRKATTSCGRGDHGAGRHVLRGRPVHSHPGLPAGLPAEPAQDALHVPDVAPEHLSQGDVCISILHAPGAETPCTTSLRPSAGRPSSPSRRSSSLVSTLAEPNDESPANIDAAVAVAPFHSHSSPPVRLQQKMWRDSRDAYAKKVKQTVQQSLGLAGQVKQPPASASSSAAAHHFSAQTWTPPQESVPTR